MRPIIVAGGGGFIGSHIVDKLLQDGKQVIVIDNFLTGDKANLDYATSNFPDKVKVYEYDIQSPEAYDLIVNEKPEIIHLLAAQMSVKVSMRDPMLDAKINIVGLVNILEAARNANVEKVVFATSGGTIYGDHDVSKLPLKEDLTRTPESFYGLTKSAAVDYLRLYAKNFGLNTAALALGNVYGPRQSPDGEAGVIAIFAKKLLNGTPCVINGDGETTRDYVHVSDVASAFIAAGTQGEGLINIGSGIETSVNDIHSHLLQILGGEAAVHGEPLSGEVRRVALSIEKAQRELSWSPQIKLEEGMHSVIDWIKSTL